MVTNLDVNLKNLLINIKVKMLKIVQKKKKKKMVDFTELPWAQGCKYLLVFACTFSGWVEASPAQTEKGHEVAWLLLREIIPWSGIPITMDSDNRPAFMAKVVQLVAEGLKITGKLHMAYPP